MIYFIGMIIGIIYGIGILLKGSSKFATILVNVVWSALCFFICLSVGTGAGVVLGIWVFVGVMINIALGGAQKDMDTEDGRKKAIKSVKDQDKYDNEWGFIDRKK